MSEAELLLLIHHVLYPEPVLFTVTKHALVPFGIDLIWNFTQVLG